jgi:hypothetical protein
MAERFLRSESDEDLAWEGPRASSEGSVESSRSQPANLPSTAEERESELRDATEKLGAFGVSSPGRSDSLGAAPPRRLSRGKISFPATDQERLLRLEEQARGNPWHRVVQGNLIIKQGLITKRKVLICHFIMVSD